MRPTRPQQLTERTTQAIARLNPGSFAFVMATGIISNAFFFEGYHAIAQALYVVNLVAFPLLLLATAMRALRFRPALWRDLTDPRIVFSFFTIIAASDVFGVQLDLRGHGDAALALWLFALIAWLALTYLSFGVLTIVNTAQHANIIHGGWLIAIVGTQSLVILGTRLAPQLPDGDVWFVLIHMLWGIGVALYGIFITLFAQRLFFSGVDAEDLHPILWVVMGAAAISTNAGAALILTDSPMPFLQTIRPFVDGTTLTLWAWGTWWIPLLVLFGLWKHGVRRMPLAYTPLFWSLVFPFGMYAAASLRLSVAANFPPLRLISSTMVWVALAAWGLTAAGLITQWRRERRDTVAAA
ncbi:MAG: tellurite resistance/C4-dicarboxylate transporter family protein [Alphaproteobacteria bacterium]|nr:tellurite resistance/C4-dicarboxylate transporter family protein [Alphaproteobacteria bacterium]